VSFGFIVTSIEPQYNRVVHLPRRARRSRAGNAAVGSQIEVAVGHRRQAGGLIHLKEKFHGFQKSLAGRSCRTVLRAAFFGFFFGAAATVPVDSGPSAATVAGVAVARDCDSD
jgi:hypothetical protein